MSDQDVNEETPIAGTTDSGGKSRKQCIIISVLLLIFLAVIAAGVLAYVFLKDKDEDPTIKPTTETEVGALGVPTTEKTTQSCDHMGMTKALSNQECSNKYYNGLWNCGCRYVCPTNNKSLRKMRLNCINKNKLPHCCVYAYCELKARSTKESCLN